MLRLISTLTLFILVVNMGPVLCQVINTGIDLMDAHDDQLINSCKSKIYSDVNECIRDVHWDQYPDTTTDQGKRHSCCRLWETFNCTLKYTVCSVKLV